MARYDGNVDSLPKWAQSKIRFLERELESRDRSLSQIEGDSDVYWEYGTGEKGGIPEHATVVFKTNTGIIRAQLINRKLHVSSYLYYLSVLPEAANVIEVAVDDRR